MAARWLAARTIDDAVAAVGDGATIVGGGAALLSTALAPAPGEVVVDVGSVLPRSVADDVIGAGTTVAELASDVTVRRRWPAVAAAAALTATPQVRTVATLGGTIGAALPTSDLLPALVVHGAEVELALGGGVRHRLLLTEHLLDPTGCGPAVVVAVRLTVAGPGGHRRVALRAGPAPAVANVSGVRSRHGVELVAGAVGLTVAPVPLVGPAWTPSAPLRADHRASAEHRSRLVAVLAHQVVADLDGSR